MKFLVLLPPASEGWEKYCFHKCLSVHSGGTLSPSHNTSNHWSHVLSWGAGGDNPPPSRNTPTGSRSLPRGYARVPPSRSGPRSGQGGGYLRHPLRSGQDGIPPSRDST